MAAPRGVELEVKTDVLQDVALADGTLADHPSDKRPKRRFDPFRAFVSSSNLEAGSNTKLKVLDPFASFVGAGLFTTTSFGGSGSKLFDAETQSHAQLFDEPSVIPTDPVELKKIETGIMCPICMENVPADISWAMEETKCGHRFHKTCIDKWLKRSNKCPLCRVQISEDPPAAEAGPTGEVVSVDIDIDDLGAALGRLQDLMRGMNIEGFEGPTQESDNAANFFGSQSLCRPCSGPDTAIDFLVSIFLGMPVGIIGAVLLTAARFALLPLLFILWPIWSCCFALGYTGEMGCGGCMFVQCMWWLLLIVAVPYAIVWNLVILLRFLWRVLTLQTTGHTNLWAEVYVEPTNYMKEKQAALFIWLIGEDILGDLDF